jgi:hypothetical protein
MRGCVRRLTRCRIAGMSSEDPKPQLTPSSKPRLRWTFGAIALLSLGILIAVPSGLCTGIFGIMAIVEPDELGVVLPMVLIFGGVPLALGALLIWLGFKVRKRE